MYELSTPPLEGNAASPSLEAPATRLVAAADRRSLGRQRGGGKPVDAVRSRRGTRGPAAAPAPRCFPSFIPRTAGLSARAAAPGRRSLWLPGAGLDPRTDRLDIYVPVGRLQTLQCLPFSIGSLVVVRRHECEPVRRVRMGCVNFERFQHGSVEAGWENCPSRWDKTQRSAPWQSGS